MERAARLPALLLLSCCAARGDAQASDCDSLAAEAFRRHLMAFPSTAGVPFDGDTNVKHKPFVRVVGSTAVVTVGLGSVTGNASEPVHPMSNSDDPDLIHYIDTIFAMDQNGTVVALRRVSPTEAPPASLTFTIPQGVDRLTVYEHCNKHGLFRGESILVMASQVSQDAPRCQPQVCSGVSAADCGAMEVELRRRHTRAFTRLEPFDGDTNVKHKPYILLSGSTATVVVGLGAVPGNSGQPVHPMTPSADPNTVHWIDHIWVKDQAGAVVAMRDLGPTEASPATLSFEVPLGTTELTAYEHCNKHGLYRGQTVAVSAAQANASAAAVCGTSCCPGATLPAPPPAKSEDCAAAAVDLVRRQAAELRVAAEPFDCARSSKHCPFLTLNGTRGRVVVGLGAFSGLAADQIHPMVAGATTAELHWIDTIYVEDQAGRVVGFRRLSPLEASPATLEFDVPEGVTELVPYEHCNIHGLFRGAPVAVSATMPLAQAGCDVQACFNLSARACAPFVLEAERIHALTFPGQSGPFQGDLDEKHKPFVMVHGTTATIVVGKRGVTGDIGDPLHPMTPSDDPNAVHWISAIWALDQHLRVIAYRDLVPSESPPASLSFPIPEGTTMISAFEHCNKHGVFAGDRRTVSANETVPGLKVNPCGFRGCTPHMPSLGEAAAAADAEAQALDDVIEATEARQQVGEICGNHTHWGYAMEKKLSPNFFAFVTPNFTERRAHFLLCGKTLGWVGLGFPQGEHAMIDSDMIRGYVGADGVAVVEDRYAEAIEAPRMDEELGGGQSLEDVGGWEVCADQNCNTGATFIHFTRSFDTGDPWDYKFSDTEQQLEVVYALQALNSDELTHHGPTRGHNTLPWNLDCQDGFFLNIEQYRCEPCNPGTYRSGVMVVSECAFCPVGSYAEQPGQAACDACPPLRTTVVPGSVEPTACLCDEGYYAGGGGGVDCQRCQLGLDCRMGSDLANYHRAQEALALHGPGGVDLRSYGSYPRPLPGFWSSKEDPSSSFRCQNADVCPGGEPEMCGRFMQSIACGECSDGYVRVAAVCEQCVSVHYLHVLPLVIFGPIFVVAGYVLLNFPIEKADLLKRVTKNVVFVFAKYSQVVALLSNTVDVNLPNAMDEVGTSLAFLVFDVEWLRLSCGLEAFQRNYVLVLCIPLVVALVFLATLFLTLPLKRLNQVQVLRKVGLQFPLDRPKLQNTYFAFVNALYIGLANAALGIFKCVEHPNKKKSIMKARHVVCYEDEWHAMLPGSACAVLVYTVGFFFMVCYICYVAPNNFHDHAFRRRWLFLFEKFRNGCWWWSVVVLLEALMLNLTSIIFVYGASQAYWMLLVLSAYQMQLFVWMPWRHWVLNFLDAFLCLCMMGMTSLALWFADRDVYGQEMKGWFAAWMVTSFAVPCMVVVACLCLMLYRQIHNGSKFIQQQVEFGIEFRQLAQWIVEAQPDHWNRFMLTLNDYDRAALRRARDALLAELLSMQPSRRSWQQRLIMGSSAREVPRGSVVANIGTLNEAKRTSRNFWGMVSWCSDELVRRAEEFQEETFGSFGGQARMAIHTMDKEAFLQVFDGCPGAAEVFDVANVRRTNRVQTAELLALIFMAADARNDANLDSESCTETQSRLDSVLRGSSKEPTAVEDRVALQVEEEEEDATQPLPKLPEEASREMPQSRSICGLRRKHPGAGDVVRNASEGHVSDYNAGRRPSTSSMAAAVAVSVRPRSIRSPQGCKASSNKLSNVDDDD